MPGGDVIMTNKDTIIKYTRSTFLFTSFVFAHSAHFRHSRNALSLPPEATFCPSGDQSTE